jgi:hypothetical protein
MTNLQCGTPLVYKPIEDLLNVQRNKKKEKGEFIKHQVSSNYHVKN